MWRTPTLDTFDSDYLTKHEKRLAMTKLPKRGKRWGKDPEPEPEPIRLEDVRKRRG